MSDRLWSSRFDRDPNVLGMTLKLNGTFRTLIGILPARFLLHGADFFFPTTFTADLTEALVGGPNDRALSVWTYARLKPGVTPEHAAANLAVVAQNVARLHPGRYPPDAQLTASVRSLADVYTRTDVKDMVYILAGAVLMLLMIACSNVANLLLARASARETELALRAGLGASRWRLMQQLLAESFVLAAVGAAIGTLLAYAGLQWVRAAIPFNGLPSEMDIRFAGEALVATVGVTLLTTILCGLAPALRAARGRLAGRLMSSGRALGARSAHGGLRQLLVAVQVTLAIVLFVGAGLMMRTLFALQAVDPGINPENVLVGQFRLPPERDQAPEERSLFVQRVMERFRTVPGVTAVSPSAGIPLRGGPASPLTVLGAELPERAIAAIEFVGAEYFQVLGLPLVSGRVLSRPDIDGARSVAVVNLRFARDFLSGADPIGRIVTFALVDRMSGAEQPSLFEIVGVVGDSRNQGLEAEVRPQAFMPYTTAGVPPGLVVLKTSVDPRTVQHALQQQVGIVDPDIALTNVGGTRLSMVLRELLDAYFFMAPAFGVGLLGAFAVVGLVLSAIGVFSVMTYAVSLQTREIGIRMALGAHPGAVMRRVLLRGLWPVGIGAATGLLASYYLSQVLESHIYGVTPTDPWTFATVVVVLTGVGLLACVLPARRAMRVDPLVALRTE
jgi:putative ABC transport system permease protein